MRFRKSIKLFPGVKLNVSKSGVSTTVGRKGLSVTTGKKGTYLNTSIPGTGLSSRKKISGSSSNQTTNESNTGREYTDGQKKAFRVILRIIGFLSLFFFMGAALAKTWAALIFLTVAFLTFYRANKIR